MKRACEDILPADARGCVSKMSDNIIHLNVGGHHFDVSPQTLLGASFFQPLITGRMPFAVDREERIFVDRSGKLFEFVLQFLRNRIRPPQHVLDACAEDLLLECQFYGIGWLNQHIKGEISPFDLCINDRKLRSEEDHARKDPKTFENKMLIDVHLTEMIQKRRDELQLPLLFGHVAQPNLPLRSFSEFYMHLNKWSHGLLEDLKDSLILNKYM